MGGRCDAWTELFRIFLCHTWNINGDGLVRMLPAYTKTALGRILEQVFQRGRKAVHASKIVQGNLSLFCLNIIFKY